MVGRCYAGASVFDFKLQRMVVPVRRDLDPTSSSTGRYGVLDRILDDWLKDEMRHFRGQRAWVDVEVDRESIAKPHLLDLQITTDEFCFFLQCDELLVLMVESQSQEVT